MAITISNNPEQFHPTRLPFCKWTSILSTQTLWEHALALYPGPHSSGKSRCRNAKPIFIGGGWLFALNPGPVRDEGQRRRCCARDIDSNMSTDSRLISLCSRLSWTGASPRRKLWIYSQHETRIKRMHWTPATARGLIACADRGFMMCHRLFIYSCRGEIDHIDILSVFPPHSS